MIIKLSDDVHLDFQIPSYKSCTVDGEKRIHGAKWNITAPGCQFCVCINGSVHCEEYCCPMVPEVCYEISTPAGECCPVCIQKTSRPTASAKPVEIPKPSQSSLNPLIFVACGVFLLLIVVVALVLYRKRFFCAKKVMSFYCCVLTINL